MREGYLAMKRKAQMSHDLVVRLPVSVCACADKDPRESSTHSSRKRNSPCFQCHQHRECLNAVVPTVYKVPLKTRCRCKTPNQKRVSSEQQ
jgi:hypothetical protein